MPTPRASAPEHRFGSSTTNRSLERGIDILRAFRPGSSWLGNSDLAERTGLSPSTISRLTQTLVGAGLLQHDARLRAYRLAPPVLSFAHAMRAGSAVLAVAAPRMKALAESRRINVGLAAPDHDDMVYLESIRYNRRVALRNVVSGQRVPMELTSLGRAYLSTVSAARRQALFEVFERRSGAHWPALRAEIHTAMAQVQEQGFCAAAWQPEVVALATPLPTLEGMHVLNLSVSTDQPLPQVARELAVPLMNLATELQAEIHRTVLA